MIAWINAITLLFATLGMHIFYLLSVRPAQLEKRIGASAYTRSGAYRFIASLLMGVISVNYFLYRWNPLPFDPLAPTFPWPYVFSIAIAIVIAFPSLYLMMRAMLDAGEETMRPGKNHALYGGIYEKLRHPMALGELPLWWVIAFLAHSPSMAVYSLVHIPIFIWWCFAEEKDLRLRYGEAYEAYRRRTGMFFPKRRRD